MPSAPRLNLSGAREPVPVPPPEPRTTVEARPADLQAAWLHTVRHLLAHTEDVGERFAEEARRIHYGEEPHRGIRGQATPEERRGAAGRRHRDDVDSRAGGARRARCSSRAGWHRGPSGPDYSTRPGFSRFSGSSAALTARIICSATGDLRAASSSRLSAPMPCSAENEPP